MEISKQKNLFKPYCKSLLIILILLIAALPTHATIEGSLDPESVVAEWSNSSTYPKVIDINFSDDTWPNTWKGETSTDCPEYDDGGYVNAILETPANGGTEITYPVLFHNCTFANKKSYNGYAGATAAFCRQYYLGESCLGNSEDTYNNWTVEGHTNYLEDNIQYDSNGTIIYGEAGFVQMCRNSGYVDVTTHKKLSRHGWVEIDHIPYVERVQWSWSSTAWGRGIKCDVKIGDGDWEPLVWMGSDKHKNGYTVFSDQGYFMENVIDASDVSIRWRVWDGDNGITNVQTTEDGSSAFGVAVDSTAQQQAPRVHKIQIFGSEITSEQAEYARENPVSSVGELSDLESEENEDEDSNNYDEIHGELLAFPTAEGFGKYTTGGRGGQVVKVTSLADSGTGTLRWAVEQYPDEPITIVFDVSGEIRLNDQLNIQRSDWTLAGQTAPGEGIVITHNKVNCGNSQNFIIRNLRFRLGQNDASGELIMQQAIGLENSSNYIVDHCSIGWTVEENTDVTDGHFITMQYCISHEGLYNAGHTKGARGYGAVFGGSPATYHHNLLANNMSRSPRFAGARNEDAVVFLEYINNVNFNWGSRNACYGGENAADISYYNGVNSVHECNFMNNYYKPGPESPSNSLFLLSSYQRDGTTSWGPAKWYINGNVMEGNDAATADNWSAVEAETYSLDDIRVDERIVTETPYYKYSIIEGKYPTYVPEDYMLYDYETAEDAYNTVISKAGTVNRDEVEQRIIEDVTSGSPKYTGSVSGKKGIIDLETDAEGFYDYSTYTVLTDTDGDGMPDEWETVHGLDPNTADQNILNADGYTALEVYLNSIMGETMSDDFTSGIGKAINMSKPEISYDKERNMIYVSENALGSTLKVYSADGQLLLSKSVSSSETSLAGLPSGILLIRVGGNGVCPRVLKVTK